MNVNFSIIEDLLLGYFLSFLVNSFVVTKFLQKVLKTPKEVKTPKGLIINNGTEKGIKLLILTKVIANFGFRVSAVLTWIAVLFFGVTSSFEIIAMPSCLNIVVSCFLVLAAMVNKNFFVSLLLGDKNTGKNSH